MHKKLKAITTICAGLFLLNIFLGCKKDSVFQYPPKPNVIINAGDSRLGSNLIHFVKDSVYILATNIIIDSGKKLLIDAGTLVKINQTVYISILPGAIIEANGTSKAPVVFTSNAAKGRQVNFGDAGTWNGLRIIGNTNQEGSGNLTYVRIEFVGAYQTALLLNNINKATTINNIEVSFSSNDSPSFEFSGGNVNASNLLSYASVGSDFIFNKGYKGNLQNLLAYRHPFFAGRERNVGGVEIKDEGTRPVISNLTIMGPSQKYVNSANYTLGNPQRRAAIITANNSKFFIRNAAIIDYPFRAYYLDSYNTARSLETGEADISYSLFYHADTAKAFYLPVAAYLPYTSADLKIFLLRERYHNELFENKGQYLLTDPYNYYDGVPNPVPLAGSPLLTGADFTDSAGVYNDPFFKKVSYRGAMGADNWLTGWVNFVPLQTDYNN